MMQGMEERLINWRLTNVHESAEAALAKRHAAAQELERAAAELEALQRRALHLQESIQEYKEETTMLSSPAPPDQVPSSQQHPSDPSIDVFTSI
ncbi:MAG: hypothetical protein Q8P67_27605 [archaeon]|nr:hypothetical protein [archaeon]